jgi:acylphosphatase
MGCCRFELTFTGRVQGVGFRWTTARIAAEHVVVGWVRNEPDGSVRCIVEGDQSELERFVAAIEQKMAGHITDTMCSRVPPTGEFADFTIRRD